METKYSYLVKITTWAEENGVEEDFTYTREFKDTDISVSQEKASEYWSEQLTAFFKGEIMPGFLGPKDSEGEDWHWSDRVDATLFFVVNEDDEVKYYPLSGEVDEMNKQGQDQERYALKTLGYGNKGIFD